MWKCEASQDSGFLPESIFLIGAESPLSAPFAPGFGGAKISGNLARVRARMAVAAYLQLVINRMEAALAAYGINLTLQCRVVFQYHDFAALQAGEVMMVMMEYIA